MLRRVHNGKPKEKLKEKGSGEPVAVPAEKALDIRRGGVRSGSRNAYRGNGSFRGEASGGVHRKRRQHCAFPASGVLRSYSGCGGRASVCAYRAYHRRSVPEKAPGGSDNGSRRTSHSVAGDGGKLGVYGARLPGQGKIQRELLRRGAAANNRGNRAVFRRVHRGFLPHRDRGRRKGGAPRRHRPQ